MCISRLSDAERQTIKLCLRASAIGPFFDDYVFPSLFPVSRQILQDVADQLDHANDDDQIALSAIGSAFNNLLRYPHRKGAALRTWVPGGRVAVQKLEEIWDAYREPIEFLQVEATRPVRIERRFFRVVHYAIKNGGHGLSTQVWRDGRWTSTDGGPGIGAIASATEASDVELREAAVECIPPGIDFHP